MKRCQFKKKDVIPLFAEYSQLINSGSAEQLAVGIRDRVRASRTVTTHGSDLNVLQYHIWARGQTFDRKYFKYEVQHDPVQRYSGSNKTNWAIQFWVSKTRGVYYERKTVMKKVRQLMSSIKLKGFQFGENNKCLCLIHKFKAADLPKIKLELDSNLFRLINAIHPTYCQIVNAFNVKLTPEQRRKIIENSDKPTRSNRPSSKISSSPEFNRNVSRRLRLALFKRDRRTCQNCGRIARESDLEAHHIIPVEHGGLTELNNLQTLCISCHDDIHRSLIQC